MKKSDNDQRNMCLLNPDSYITNVSTDALKASLLKLFFVLHVLLYVVTSQEMTKF